MGVNGLKGLVAIAKRVEGLDQAHQEARGCKMWNVPLHSMDHLCGVQLHNMQP